MAYCPHPRTERRFIRTLDGYENWLCMWCGSNEWTLLPAPEPVAQTA